MDIRKKHPTHTVSIGTLDPGRTCIDKDNNILLISTITIEYSLVKGNLDDDRDTLEEVDGDKNTLAVNISNGEADIYPDDTQVAVVDIVAEIQ